MSHACGHCGNDDRKHRSFVRYHPDPNDGQRRTEWADKIDDPIYGLICRECGYIMAIVDPRTEADIDLDELPEGGRASERYRIDRDRDLE